MNFEALAAALNGARIENVNFIETVQNYYADSSRTVTAVTAADPLSYYIPQADLLQAVKRCAAERCEKPADVKRLVYDQLLASGYSAAMLRSRPFLEALIPHLVRLSSPSVENLQRTFQRTV